MKKLILAVALLTVMVPAQAERWNKKMTKLDLGMTTEQVTKILGRPTAQQMYKGHLLWIYQGKMMAYWSGGRGDYYVAFMSGEVARYGRLQINTNSWDGVGGPVFIW